MAKMGFLQREAKGVTGDPAPGAASRKMVRKSETGNSNLHDKCQ